MPHKTIKAFWYLNTTFLTKLGLRSAHCHAVKRLVRHNQHRSLHQWVSSCEFIRPFLYSITTLLPHFEITIKGYFANVVDILSFFICFKSTLSSTQISLYTALRFSSPYWSSLVGSSVHEHQWRNFFTYTFEILNKCTFRITNCFTQFPV